MSKGISVLMNRVLYLDDIRRVPKDTASDKYELVRDFYEFQQWIVENGMPDVLDLDHDLGGDKTGYDCIKFCLGFHSAHPEQKVPKLRVHSANPIGAENIISYYENYLRFQESK